MKTKTYYYHFNKWDTCFIAMGLALILAISLGGGILWTLFIIAAGLWAYKNLWRQKAVVITDNDIKIDHANPLLWQDIQNAKIQTVRLCGREMKILSLIPKQNIQYRYNYLQRYNGAFGAFPVPLYGILTPADEQEIIQIVKKHVSVKE